MKWKRKLQYLRFYTQFWPFTYNALLLGLTLGLAFYALRPDTAAADSEEASSFLPFLLLMGKTALLFFCAFIAISFLSTLFCWIYYLWLSKRKHYPVKFAFDTKGKYQNSIVLTASIDKVRRPILGFIKSRLIYDDLRLTEKFTLSGNKKHKNKFWRKSVFVTDRLSLPDIKEYTLSGSFVFFEDMLQLFSFPVYQQQTGNFYQAPQKVSYKEEDVQPQYAEDAQIRTDEVRTVEGDYLNYKSFESGDDIRRIVWKVYAKNRELVVRVPEMRDRYASHVYFFASFFTDLTALQTDTAFGKEMLNYFKNRIWSVYITLHDKQKSVRFLPDQLLQLSESDSEVQAFQRVISNCQWQRDNNLTDYFNPSRASVLCVSSFSSPHEIAAVLAYCGRDTVVYYVRLSAAFQHAVALSWLGKLFFRFPEDRLKKIRGPWMFMPFRFQLLKREKKIEDVLKESNVVVGMI